jgi:protein TonB
MLTHLQNGQGRKRSPWSATTVGVSVSVHLLLLAGVIYATTQGQEVVAPPDEPMPPFIEIPLAKPDLKPQPPEVRRVPASVSTPAAPANPALTPPRDIPPTITPEPAGVQPVDPGAPIVAGDPNAPGDPNARPSGEDPGATAQAGHADPTEPYTTEAVHVGPSLENMREVQRTLQRLYPLPLRDSGVTGTVVLRFVIDTDGRVEPSTIQVVSTTHPAFGDAAVEAAKKLRFEPAKVNGKSVRVLTSMPIRWQLNQE